ncbi:MAG: ATP-binding protein, partial [Candidatus Margulisbacteria bacterium]|nr:ATP-binding protein [Candidatus Margulisiibacteriota bacterium]
MNPFTYGKVVSGGSFFDRRTETLRIVNTLRSGNNLVLYAPRRFGKTSLVFRVMERLAKENFVCIYFDFMPVYSPESFVRLFTKAVAEKQSGGAKFLQRFSAMLKNIRPVLTVNDSGQQEFSIDFTAAALDETTILNLLDLPETLAGKNKRVAVFFDEFQEVEKLRSINFEKLLRSKIQLQSKTNYLFLGSKTHLLKEMFNNKKRAFYNSAQQMTLSALPEKDTIEYLQKKMAAHKISLADAEARYLIASAGQVPHYVQMLASEVW